MPYAVENHQELGMTRMQWVLQVRGAASGQPTFVFFPHAGATPFSIGRLPSVLPQSAGIVVIALPRGGDLDEGTPPRSVTDAARGVAEAITALHHTHATGMIRLVFVGNSYGALLAYETARCLAHTTLPVERLIVSGFRSPALPMADSPLYRLPLSQLSAELAARFGLAPDGGAMWAEGEVALRADLCACDTYHHRHDQPLPVPIDVLHLTKDTSVSVDELQAWRAVTQLPLRLMSCPAGHFPWAECPDVIATALLQLAVARQANLISSSNGNRF